MKLSKVVPWIVNSVTFVAALAWLILTGPAWYVGVLDVIPSHTAIVGAIAIVVLSIGTVWSRVGDREHGADIGEEAFGCAAALVLSVILVAPGAFVAAAAYGAAMQTVPVRTFYAQRHPEAALDREWSRVEPLLETVFEQDGHYPADAEALADTVSWEETRLRYSALEDGRWVDPWGQPFVYEGRTDAEGAVVGYRIYSVGPDGQDNEGEADDLLLGSVVDSSEAVTADD